MHDPSRANGNPMPPQFGYTVDPNLLPHQRVRHPMAVMLAMGLVPLIAVLGVGAVAMMTLGRGNLSLTVGGLLQVAFWILVGIAIIEILLWRGLAECRVITFVFVAGGAMFEALFAFGRLGDLGSVQDEPLGMGRQVLLTAVAVIQVLALAALFIALTRHEVGDWIRAVRQLRYERKRRAGQPWW